MRNRDTNIHHVYGEINVLVSLCSSKHRIPNMTKTGKNAHDWDTKVDVNTVNKCFSHHNLPDGVLLLLQSLRDVTMEALKLKRRKRGTVVALQLQVGRQRANLRGDTACEYLWRTCLKFVRGS